VTRRDDPRRLPRLRRLRALAPSDRGIAATEFGLIAPVLFVVLFGAFDIGHTLYVKSVLEGAVQKAARDSTLQGASGTSATARTAIDTKVKNQLLPLWPGATVAFKRRFYRTFSAAAAAAAEPFTDSASGPFKNGKCDNGESFTDSNNNGTRDTDGGDSADRASARDNVVYTVTVSYPRVFPLDAFINVPPTTQLQATTVLANQPYGKQNTYSTPTVGHCP
jgi:hypothetical protein